jgi:hypothetical protein
VHTTGAVNGHFQDSHPLTIPSLSASANKLALLTRPQQDAITPVQAIFRQNLLSARWRSFDCWQRPGDPDRLSAAPRLPGCPSPPGPLGLRHRFHDMDGGRGPRTLSPALSLVLTWPNPTAPLLCLRPPHHQPLCCDSVWCWGNRRPRSGDSANPPSEPSHSLTFYVFCYYKAMPDHVDELLVCDGRIGTSLIPFPL